MSSLCRTSVAGDIVESGGPGFGESMLVAEDSSAGCMGLHEDECSQDSSEPGGRCWRLWVK
jgi:hypothetical protein